MPYEIDLTFFAVYEFNNYSLNGTVKVPFFYYGYFEVCYGMFWDTEMFRCYLVLALSPDDKVVYINSFAQHFPVCAM